MQLVLSQAEVYQLESSCTNQSATTDLSVVSLRQPLLL